MKQILVMMVAMVLVVVAILVIALAMVARGNMFLCGRFSEWLVIQLALRATFAFNLCTCAQLRRCELTPEMWVCTHCIAALWSKMPQFPVPYPGSVISRAPRNPKIFSL